MTESEPKRMCPRHPRIALREVFDYNPDTRTWYGTGLYWCRRDQAAFREDWLREPTAGMTAIVVDPGPDGCGLCAVSNTPCVACTTKVCSAHASYVRWNGGVREVVCTSCWTRLLPARDRRYARPVRRLAPA